MAVRWVNERLERSSTLRISTHAHCERPTRCCPQSNQAFHFHEMLTDCLSQPHAISGHSTRIATAGDGACALERP
jgi:hypothetical protein